MNGRNNLAELEKLRSVELTPALSERFRVRSRRSTAVPIDLPWLDVDRAAVIGGGADYGDDTRLVLDFRSSIFDPRVLVNEWHHGTVSEVFWRVASSRRRGIGLKLLHAAVARVTERSARFIWRNTNERNLDAVRLYTRAGFPSERERWQGGRQLWLERAL
jgi:GNAT superfamily N-acetyltransferase